MQIIARNHQLNQDCIQNFQTVGGKWFYKIKLQTAEQIIVYVKLYFSKIDRIKMNTKIIKL